LRKNFFWKKNIIIFPSKKNSQEKLHSSYIRKTFIYFPFLLEKKAKILRERVTQCTLCFRKKRLFLSFHVSDNFH